MMMISMMIISNKVLSFCFKVSRFRREMEDMQLQKQIEDLKRELEEAKTGKFSF